MRKTAVWSAQERFELTKLVRNRMTEARSTPKGARKASISGFAIAGSAEGVC